MPKRMNISEARARLPELAHHVANSSEKVVLIDHRDLDGPFALTTAAHLEYLTRTIEELRSRVGEPFRLAGSIASALSDEDLEAELNEIRKEQDLLADSKIRSLTE